MDIKTKIIIQSEKLFLRYGIKSVTMDDIARKLGMSKKTLYQYVDNKTDLLGQIMVAHVQQHESALANIRAKAKDAVDEMIQMAKFVLKDLRRIAPTTMYDLQKYYPDIWNMMEQLHKKHIYATIIENLNMGIQQGVYRSDINTDVVAKLYVGKTLFLIDEEMFPLRDYDRTNLFKEYINYHTRGIASPKGLNLFNQYISQL